MVVMIFHVKNMMEKLLLHILFVYVCANLKGRYFIIILGELNIVNVPKPINRIIAILINVIIPIKKDFIVLTDTSVFF